MNHLAALVEGKAINSTDLARLKGYILKWRQSKMLIGAALYIDVLKSPSILSLCLQDDCLDIVGGISKSLKALSEEDALQWPTIKLV